MSVAGTQTLYPPSSYPSNPLIETHEWDVKTITNGLVGSTGVIYTNNSTQTPGLKEYGDKWKGRSHKKLSEEGYRSLSYIATFLAAVQAQVLSSNLGNKGAENDIINAAFMGGLLADIFTAMLSFASARWFEMLTCEEDRHLQKSWADVESGRRYEVGDYTYVDRWVSVAVLVAPYTMAIGLGFFIVGLMIQVWTYQATLVKIFCSIICTFCMTCMIPFALKHNRMKVISLLGLKRRSD